MNPATVAPTVVGIDRQAVWRVAPAALLWLCGAVSAATDAWVNGKVVSVTDGDTAVVATAQGKTLRIRFYGVDAPERANDDWPAQAFSADASAFMRKLIMDRAVTVRLTGEQTHGREVGEVFVDGRSASRELVRSGLGWWNERHAREDLDLERLEQAARDARRGLWQGKRPKPPWEYRQQHRPRP